MRRTQQAISARCLQLARRRRTGGSCLFQRLARRAVALERDQAQADSRRMAQLRTAFLIESGQTEKPECHASDQRNAELCLRCCRRAAQNPSALAGIRSGAREPVRPLVDRAVLGFAMSTELHPADFTVRSDGECRLNPQLARLVVGIAANVEKEVAFRAP